MRKEALSTMIPTEEREKYLEEFHKIKARFAEPQARQETPQEKEARMNLIFREMGKLFVLEEKA